jgi:feruloyl esterase
VTISSVDDVAAGKISIPKERFDLFPAFNLTGRVEQGSNPTMCRVAATLKPSPASQIKIEVWLPKEHWNGKFLGVGNFGWAGSIIQDGLLSGVQAGFAVAATDTGHDGAASQGGGKWSMGNPEALIDYAWRADHEMTLVAKSLIQTYYGKAPEKSYWIGCSLGGLEGLIEAKRFPQDYDAMAIGAPPNPLVDFNALQIWPWWLISQKPERQIPREKYTMIHDAVLQACATQQGQRDGVVDRPRNCSFKPISLLCAQGDAADCLTMAQVELLEETYAGPLDPVTDERIFPGPAMGSELEMFGSASDQPMSVALDLFRYTAFQTPDWDARTIDWHKDISSVEAKLAPLLSVAPEDLEPYINRGGKILLYIGWTDYHNPEQLADFYGKVLAKAGSTSKDRVRLFAIPGMAHCSNGTGCDTFDKLGILDAWAVRGVAPDQITTSKVENGKVVRVRPACAWPLVASYRGTGEENDPANYHCQTD